MTLFNQGMYWHVLCVSWLSAVFCHEIKLANILR
jgi:hypothetical protein